MVQMDQRCYWVLTPFSTLTALKLLVSKLITVIITMLKDLKRWSGLSKTLLQLLTHISLSQCSENLRKFWFSFFLFPSHNILILKGWGLGKWGRNEVERIAPRSPGSLKGDFLHQFDLISSTFSQHFWHALTS